MSTCPKRIRALSLFAAIALALGFTLLSQEGVAYAADGQDTLTSASLATQEGPEAEAVELAITNNTGMFKAVSASAVENADGSATLTVTLSGTSYHYLYKGTYEQAVANGNATENWIAGHENAEGKWDFQIPVTADELGTDVPVVSISQTYYDKYLNGKNSLARSFYPRQFNLDLDAATLTTGDFEVTKAIVVTDNVQMLKVNGAALESVGGPNSNNYKADLVLTMGSDSYDAAFVGNYAEAAEAVSVIDFDGGASTFTVPVKWLVTFGKPETLVTLCNGEPFFLSLKSKENGNWYECKAALDEAAGTLVLDPSAADYASVVEAQAAAAALDRSLYTEESLSVLDGALAVVAEGKFESQQAEVDAMAQAITDAIAALAPVKKVQTITASDIAKTYGDAAFSLGAKTSGDGALTYAVTSGSNVSVDAAGKVTVKGAGAATITVTAAETANYKKATKTIKVTIAKKAQAIVAANRAVSMGKTVSLAAKASGEGALSYKSSNTKVIKVNSKGVVTPVNVGTAKITITASATTNYVKATKTVTVKVRQGTQGIAFANQTKSVKLYKVQRASQVVAISKATKAKTAVTYSITKVSKSKASFSIDKKTGKITVKKGLKKGTYKVTVKATAAKTANYKAIAKSAVITIKVG